MRILLINPKYPDTYWSFNHALKFISKKATNPPLGLLTVAAMLPAEWKKKVVDLNVNHLRDADIQQADYVFIGAMSVQAESVTQVIDRCRAQGKKIVAGGPLFTGDPDPYMHLDHLVLNEAEITFPRFLSDLENGQPQKVYQTDEFADMSLSPAPDYSLINISRYAQMNLQYSRGCPFNCDFCEITALLGRKVRVKSTSQILTELENIYQTGFRGDVFFVDDNFIGNRKRLKNDLLPEIIRWSEDRKNPFTFTTEASIDLADDPVLMDRMARAGFKKVFVGIETTEEESLVECGKMHNTGRNMVISVKTIQSAGMEVMGGFIVGFDHDSPGVFQRQIDFIRQSGIMTAMVGLLNAPSRTKLYERLHGEGRILQRFGGNNTDYSMNFIPKMDTEVLQKGYRHILESIYSSKAYYERVIYFLKDFQPQAKAGTAITVKHIQALLRSIFVIGIFSRSRVYYWKLFLWSLFRRPRLFPMAITYSIYGYHFQKVFGINN
ncbi:MAG: B12-binding domain-containing radical SAM protein [Bacteroidales bacterium]